MINRHWMSNKHLHTNSVKNHSTENVMSVFICKITIHPKPYDIQSFLQELL